MIFVASLVFIFLLIRFGVTSYNYFTDPVLEYNLKMSENEYENFQLSILIPARNEEVNLQKVLPIYDSLIKINSLVKEVVVLNDNSNDKTSEIIEHFSIINPKIKIVNGAKLPSDWLGKNWACHQLAQKATGNYFLFTDADVYLENELIINSLVQFKKEKLDLLSIFPNQQMLTIGEKIIVPMMHYLLLSLLPLRLVKKSKNPSFSAANGQFMLFKAETYRSFCFHEKVKTSVLDDVSIIKELKISGLKGEVLLGNHQVSCRMYSSGLNAFQGFSKNLFLGFNNNIFALFFYHFIIFWGWIAILLSFNFYLIIASFSISLLIRMIISKLSGQSVVENIVLHFIQIPVFVYTGLQSAYLKYAGKNYWKGRKI
jgi:chlorobactene glucosyltransferase